ncbi:MAG: AAA family ATPase [Synergistaceae bacterium]|jgi:predicted ATPase|nr:AAA family ATPase [Synergistaceae bacterium]
MNQNHLSRVLIKGYKLFEDCEVKLERLNVLIGPNGGGKSSFIEFFNLISHIFDGHLQEYVAHSGGPDAMLRFGREVTREISSELVFGSRSYRFAISPAEDGRMVFSEEAVYHGDKCEFSAGSGHFESRIREFSQEIPNVRCQMFHFQDVSAASAIRQPHPLKCDGKLSPDGGNLAAYLYALKEEHNSDYQRVLKRLQIIAPFFEDFFLEPDDDDPASIRLRWLERGNSQPLDARLMSDGMLRFASILTVFRYPKERRLDTLIIDEPDIGLHPKALELIYHIIFVVSNYRQVIISTQSTELLNKFNAEDIIILDRKGGRTTLSRLDTDELEEWLSNRTISEIWANSIIGGLPTL